jgi:hypothetical protein
MTGSVPFCFASHYVTTTVSASAEISASIESASLELVRFTFSPNVVPPSIEALKITSPFVFGGPKDYFSICVWSPFVSKPNDIYIIAHHNGWCFFHRIC